MTQSIAQHLQSWLIRNDVSIIDPLFVPAVDHAIDNAVRDQCVNRRATKSEIVKDGLARDSTAI